MSIRAVFGESSDSLPHSILEENSIGRWVGSDPWSCENGILEVRRHASFPDARTVWETPSSILAISGILYREPELSSFEELSRQLSHDSVNQWGSIGPFVRSLEGEFGGLIFDRTSNRLWLFSNKCGTTPLYYSVHGAIRLCSTHLVEHARMMAGIGASVRIAEDGALFYLSQGAMIDDRTLIEGVQRVLPGELAEIDLNEQGSARREYHRFRQKDSLVGEDAIEAFDAAFSQAVRVRYSFDRAHRKAHLGCLSGGLDSRMDCLVAADEGYGARTNLTFGEPGCADLRIAEEISKALNQSQITVGLAEGRFIIESLSEACLANGGISVAIGSTHQLHAQKQVDWRPYGLLHTGTLGGAPKGSGLAGPMDPTPADDRGAYGPLFAEELFEAKKEVVAKYGSHEAFILYTRGFLTNNGGAAMLTPYFLQTTPFMDTEVLETVYSIPTSFRYRNEFYRRWLATKRPLAGKFIWDRTMDRPTASRIFGRSPREWWIKGWGRARRLAFGGGTRALVSGTNPFDKWMRQNSDLRNYCQEELKRLAPLGEHSLAPKQWARLDSGLGHCSALDRLQVLSFLLTAEWIVGAGQVRRQTPAQSTADTQPACSAASTRPIEMDSG